MYTPRTGLTSTIQVHPLDAALLSRFGETDCHVFALHSSALRCPAEDGGDSDEAGSDSDEAPPPRLAGQQEAGREPPTHVVPLLARQTLEDGSRACFSPKCIVPSRPGRRTCASHRFLEPRAHEARTTQQAERLNAMTVSAELCMHTHHTSSMHLPCAHCIEYARRSGACTVHLPGRPQP